MIMVSTNTWFLIIGGVIVGYDYRNINNLSIRIVNYFRV